MSTVTITEDPLALGDLLAIVDGAQVQLSQGARQLIAASRAVVDLALVDKSAVYGLTTQVGHGKDTILTEEQIRGEQHWAGAADTSGTCSAGRPAQRNRAWRLWGLACGCRRARGDAERRCAPGDSRDRIGWSG